MQKITFEDLPSTNTPINANNLNAMQTNAEAAIGAIDTKADTIDTKADNIQDDVDNLKIALGLDQDTFSTSSTYVVGDLVIYNNTIYECTTAVTTAGDWDSSKWTIVPIIVNS